MSVVEKRAASWEGFLELATKAQEALGRKRRKGVPEECFFRGHSDEKYSLLPTLYRAGKDLNDDDLLEAEADLFWEFQARAQELHGLTGQALTDWDYLFYMRHHGGYTRLLDWTESLGVAVYFAIEKIRDGKAGGSERPCVWVLNPYELNAKEWKGTRDLANPHYLMDDDESWDYGDFLLAPKNFPKGPIAVYPIQRSNRVRAQRGWFTMHGSDRRGIEESVPKALWKIVLEKDAEAGALAFLEHAGLNAYTIYSDLDSLTRELHRKNRLL